MSDIIKLWEYQQAEISLEEYEAKLKSTATRRRLIKIQHYLQEQQGVLAAMENEMRVRLSETLDASSQSEALTQQLEEKKRILDMIEKKGAQDLEMPDIKDIVKDYETLYDGIIKNKKSIVNIQMQVQKSEADLKSIISRVNRARKEFAALKEAYAKELEAGSPEAVKLRTALEEAAKNIDPKLLERYKRIKKNKKDPVAYVVDGKCAGCNMQLPSGDLISYAHSDRIFECENCGRMLFIKQ